MTQGPRALTGLSGAGEGDNDGRHSTRKQRVKTSTRREHEPQQLTSFLPHVYSLPSMSPAMQCTAAEPAAMKAILMPCNITTRSEHRVTEQGFSFSRSDILPALTIMFFKRWGSSRLGYSASLSPSSWGVEGDTTQQLRQTAAGGPLRLPTTKGTAVGPASNSPSSAFRRCDRAANNKQTW